MAEFGSFRLGDLTLDAPSTSSSSQASTTSLDTIEVEKNRPDSIVSVQIIHNLAAKGINVRHDGLVSWMPHSDQHPRNWTHIRKCYDTGIILFLEFLMTLVSNTGSSTAEQTFAFFGISKKTCLLYFTFAYLCGQACGGLFLPPVSETFGTRMIYVVTTALFGIGNLLIAAFPSPAVVVAARLCCGFFSAAPGTVAAGTIESIWDVRARVWTIHLWVVSAILGLAAGPGIATLICLSDLGWRWLYMILGLISITTAVFCLFMRESRPSKILLKEIRKIGGRNSALFTEDSAAALSFRTFCHTSLLLPMQLFFTEPIVALTSIMAASVYAIIYIFPEALPHVYHDFGFDKTQISLVNLALICGIPFTFGSRLIDVRLAKRRERQGVPHEPEDKITGFILAAPCLAISFFVFAASVPPLQTHITPWISVACLAGIGFSTVEFDNVLSGYLTDSYSSWAASANAPMSFLRATLSAIFPLFADDVYTKLGASNATFVLAGIATLYCVAALWFARCGKAYREKSKFATSIARTLVTHENTSQEKLVGQT